MLWGLVDMLMSMSFSDGRSTQMHKACIDHAQVCTNFGLTLFSGSSHIGVATTSSIFGFEVLTGQLKRTVMAAEAPRLYVSNLPYVAQKADIERLFDDNKIAM